MEKTISKNKPVNVDILMGHVFKLWCRNKKQILEEFDLTGSQFDILFAIYQLSKNEKSIIQVDLSEKTGIDPMTTSTTLRNLEKKNLVIRSRDLVNTRVINVFITEEGKKLLHLAISKMESVCKALYRNIDQKNLENQLLQLSKELNKLNN